MKRRCGSGWLAIAVVFGVTPAFAGLSTVQSPPGSEDTHEEILEGIYGGSFSGSGTSLGFGNWSVYSNGTITVTRVDDYGFIPFIHMLYGAPGTGDDDVWTDGIATASAEARFAGYSQEFGYDSGSGYVKLFEVSGSGYSVSGGTIVEFGLGSTWQWARANDSDAGLTNDHYSNEPSNGDGLDHMVTYQVTGIPGLPVTTNVWLLFWEDVSGDESDRDFNDLVIELRVVDCIDDSDCDDDNACTRNKCKSGVCMYPPKDPGYSCDADGDYCTVDECDGNGNCVNDDVVTCPGPTGPCDGGKACNQSTGLCVPLPDLPAGTTCDRDNDLCTEDKCTSYGQCVFKDDVDCPGATGPCDGGTVCNSTTGACDSLPDPGPSTPCEREGDLCTIDFCNGSGSCVTTSTVSCQSADPPCEAGQVCNSSTGLCENLPDAGSSTSCEADGDLCTIDRCNGSGACVHQSDVSCPGPTGPCDGGKQCNATTGLCEDLPDPDSSTPCEREGDLCTIDFCNGSGSCVTTSTVTCQLADPPCEAGQVCNGNTGSCEDLPDAGTSTTCEADGDLCTIDRCNGAGQCVHQSDVSCPGPTGPCDGGKDCNPTNGMCENLPDPDSSTPCEREGDLCTIDFCNGSGSCVTTSTVTCQPADPPCEAGQVCNSSTGSCEDLPDAGTSTNCEFDGDLCTHDRCDGGGNCATVSTVTCAGPVPPCEAGQECNPSTGMCFDLTDPDSSTVCDRDSDLCTIDYCNGAGSCVNTGSVNCPGSTGPCDAGENCEPSTGMCVEKPDLPSGTMCEADGDKCTNDECDGDGNCEFVSDVICPGPTDTCDGGTECNMATGACDPLPDPGTSTSCEREGDLCTIDFCDGAGNCITTQLVDCADPIPPCEAGEVCNPTTGMCDDVTDPGTSTVCELDGDLCTIDRCDGAGNCATTNTVTCPGPVPPCEAGQECNATTGMCEDLLDADPSTSCEREGDLCTIDFCDGAGNCITTQLVDCADPVPPCEAGEVCNPSTGMCDELTDPGTSTVCDLDGDLCSIDHCDGAGNCANTGTVTCQAPDPPCEAGQECNPTTGDCDDLTDPDANTSCDRDSDLCTLDNCDGSGNCVPGGNVDCDDPVPPCEAGQQCNPATGICDDLTDPGSSTSCEVDGDLCTIDRCDGTGGCETTGTVPCAGPNPPCEAGQQCNPSTGACDDLTDAGTSTVCERDGDLCTTDRCNGSGSCVTTGTVSCAAPIPPCEAGQQCNPGTGACDNLPDTPAGTTCVTDSNPCTGQQCDGAGQCLTTSNICGACCFTSGTCLNNRTLIGCESSGGDFMGEATLCAGDSNSDGRDDLCFPPPSMVPIPTVSEWGLVILSLLLLVIGKIHFGRLPLAATVRSR